MRILIVIFASILVSSGVAQADSGSAGTKGALIGAGVGAMIGHQKGDTAKGAVVGAVGGYILGSAVGAAHSQEQREHYNGNTRSKVVVHEQNGSYANRQKGHATIKKNRGLNRCHEAQEFYDKAFRVKSVAKQVYLLEKAAWYCPEDARVHNDLGVSYYNLGGKINKKRARDQFQIALYLRPNYMAAKKNLRKVDH